MANVIQIKRGSGAPTTSNTSAYELAYDYTNDKLYIHDGASSSMVEIGGGGGNSTATSSFLTGDSLVSYDGYIMTRGIVNENETGGTPAAIVFGNGATYGNDNLSLITSGATALFINSSGNVGIGGTTANRDLQINGTGIIRLKDADGDPGLDFGDAEMQLRYRTASDKLQVYSYGTTSNVLTIQKSNGNVGIAEESPDTLLHIKNSGSGSLTTLKLEDNARLMYLGRDSIAVKDLSNSAAQLYINSNTTFSGTINTNGNVTIGGGGDLILSDSGGSTSTYLYNDGVSLIGHIGGAERFRFDNSGKMGIGTNAPYERLYVQCEDATSPGIVSNPSQTNGAIAYAIGYGDANTDYLNTWGMAYSSAANVFGYGVKPSTTADETFLISADNSNFTRGALYFDNELKFFNAGAVQGTLDAAVTMTERFRVDADGDGFFDRDVVAFSTTVSDKRLKDNVKTIDNAIDKVMRLRGVEFDWNATSRKGQHDIGLIAQEVEEVLPEVVIDKKLCMGDMKGNEKDYKTVDYEKMVGVLIEAIKEQQKQINELEEKLNG